ncbi:MAG: NPCBM/NEW2 domain-containing protein [Armatimonadetes bacterium]|nr:NPCBM/NEW2 domain-containing protein [Armatimonadota bacterium]
MDSNVVLSSLDLSRAVQLWGRPRKDVSISDKPMLIAGRAFSNGFGTHTPSRLFVYLNGRASRFTGAVGVDDGGNERGSVEFRFIGDGRVLWSSGVMRHGQAAMPVAVGVTGVRYLTLEAADSGDGIGGDHANWADARFEGVRGRINAIERLPEHQGQIVSGAAWRDTEGNLIQAHGGGILVHGGKYYWYGEDRSEGYVAIGTSGYVSEDLVNWKPLGVVLPKSAYDEKWKERNINERPKVVYNPRTGKFVMWFHYDRSGYGDSQAGVAIADTPEGPFRFLGMHRPIEKSTYRDMNLFVDDDGTAYAIYAGEENYTMHIVRLNAEWTLPEMPMVEGKTWIRTLIRAHREAPAPFKHNGKYYMITSAATGWNPNPANYAVADSMLGEWKIVGNPFIGAGTETTFGSQSTFVLPVPGRPGSFIYMGDRWNPSNLADARYVWLPFQMKSDGTFEIRYRDSWEPRELGFPAPRLTGATPIWGTEDIAPAVPADFSGKSLKYRLGSNFELWPLDKRRSVVEAMDAAVRLYNQMGEFPKNAIAIYSPNIPATVGSYDGTLRFSKEISRRAAVRELGRALGIGTHPRWDSLVKDGQWTGPQAIAQLRKFDGPKAILRAEQGHFSPYGLNSEKESTPENERRYIQLVAAMRRDMAIVSEPIRGMIGVGTWETQAEFKDIRVTKGNQTLFSSDFSRGLEGWKTTRGKWEVVDGALRQTGDGTGARALIGDPTWSDYTLSLKARKLSGAEGFLIFFGMPTEDAKSQWNVGGWGNTQHGLEVPEIPLTQVRGKIETGRWCDIRIEVQGPAVKAYLDGKLVQEARR